jgi:hypothetical protein
VGNSRILLKGTQFNIVTVKHKLLGYWWHLRPEDSASIRRALSWSRLCYSILGEQYAPQFGIHKAGNSAVLRLIAPKYLDWQIPFEEQIDVVEDHLRLVALLCETAKQIDRERLSAFYAVAAPEKLK